jgi:hypothetical protein
VTDLVRVKRGRLPWVTEPESGGSSGGTLALEGSTDPDTFLWDSDVIDLGGPALLSGPITLTAFDPDGESIGVPGGITTVYHNAYAIDGATFTAFDSGLSVLSPPATDVDGDSGGADVVGQLWAVLAEVPRYLKFRYFIAEADSGSIYAGANHPTATISIALDYR